MSDSPPAPPALSPVPLSSMPPPSLSLPAPLPPALLAVSGEQQWVVEFARYFNFPRRSSVSSVASASASSSSGKVRLRPLPRGKRRIRGMWLPAASPAVLHIGPHPVAAAAAAAAAAASRSNGGAPPATVLSVSVGRNVFEEHLVSSLYYSWPQVSCVPECPVRGSRAVFFSYKDSNKVEKFAVRFPTGSDAEKFLYSVKGYVPGSSWQGDEEGNKHVNLINGGDKQLSLDDAGTSDANKQIVVVDSAELKSQIMKCIAESSFHGMLSKLDKAINALGGDLSL